MNSQSSSPASLQPRRVGVDALSRALLTGWARFVASRNTSVSYAMIFAIIGLVILLAVEHADVAPMALPAAGGFMLIGPMLLAGFFSLTDTLDAKAKPTLALVFDGFRETPRELWVLALVCALLFMIWMTDAATLYGFMVGRVPAPFAIFVPPPERVVSFILWSSVMGAVLAFVIFSISAFAVPLIYYRRAGLIGGVVASVKAVFRNLLQALLWAFLIGAATILSIFVLPLFLIVFPVLAFASHALYREVFPE